MLTATEPQGSEPELSAANACACPRCGYDQRGVVRMWAEQCPMEGTCSECGLVFVWCEVLVPEKFEPRWCVEFSVGRLRLLWSCVQTFVRTILPWRFWRRLRMSFSLRPRRLVLYCAMMFTPAIVGYAIAQTSVSLYVRHQMSTDVQKWNKAVPGYIQNLSLLKTRAQIGFWLVHPYERSAFDLSMEWLETLKSCVQPPARVDHSAFECVIESVLFPLASQSWGDIAVADQHQPYPAPNELWEQAFDKQISSYTVQRELSESTACFRYVCFGTILFMTLPASFVFLPVSRRRAGVRRQHFVRIVAYGAIIPVGFAHLFGLGVLARILANVFDFGEEIVLPFQAVLGWAILIAVGLWWWAATRSYLRLPHPLLVVLLLMIMSALFVFALAWYVVGLNVLEVIR